MENLPRRLVAKIWEGYPHVWQAINAVRAMRGKDLPDWDNAVFLPYGAWYAVACTLLGKKNLTVEDTVILNEIAFAGTWKQCPNIACIEPGILKALKDAPYEGNLPVDTLWKLPHWCIYADSSIEAGGVIWQGFMAMLEEDIEDKHRELRLLFMDEGGSAFISVHLGDWSVEQGYGRMMQDADLIIRTLELPPMPDEREQMLHGLKQAVSILLYICEHPESHKIADIGQNVSPPQRLVNEIARKYPNVWRMGDIIRQRMQEHPERLWPEQVFVPVNAWITCRKEAGLPENIVASDVFDIQRAACAAAWRPGQDIVRFDPDVLAAIADTPLDGTLPAEILMRLPAWAIYVETPGFVMYDRVWDGFIARIDLRRPREICLRLMFLSDAQDLELVLILDGYTLKDAFTKSFEDMAKLMGEIPENYFPKKELEFAVNLVLYICAYGLTDSSGDTSKTAYPRPKKVKGGWRLFPPDKPRVHILGAGFGRQIRAGREAARSGSHAGPRPHIRRAHWHSYWTGPKAAQKIVVHWLPPIPVAMAEDDKD